MALDRLRDRVNRIASVDRLTRIGRSVVFGLAVAFVVVVAGSDGLATPGGGRLGGDWAAFWAAGALFRQDPALLLDLDAQLATTAPYLDGNVLPFPYPPLLAALYALPSMLPFTVGYVVVVAILTVLAVVASNWAMQVLAVPAHVRPLGRLGALSFAGTAVAIFGTQTTILVLAAVCGAMLLMHRGGSVAAGCVLGLLWFKPQFALPVLLLLAVAGHRRTAAIGLAGAPLWWGANAMVFGRGWMVVWLRDIVAFVDAGNQAGNLDQTISVVEWVRAILPSPIDDPVSVSIALVLGGLFAYQASRTRDPRSLLPLVCAAMVLTALHALQYELAMLVPTLLATAATGGRRYVPALLGMWLVAPVVVIADIAVLGIAFAASIIGLWHLSTRPPMPGPDTTTPGVLTGTT